MHFLNFFIRVLLVSWKTPNTALWMLLPCSMKITTQASSLQISLCTVSCKGKEWTWIYIPLHTHASTHARTRTHTHQSGSAMFTKWISTRFSSLNLCSCFLSHIKTTMHPSFKCSAQHQHDTQFPSSVRIDAFYIVWLPLKTVLNITDHVKVLCKAVNQFWTPSVLSDATLKVSTASSYRTAGTDSYIENLITEDWADHLFCV